MTLLARVQAFDTATVDENFNTGNRGLPAAQSLSAFMIRRRQAILGIGSSYLYSAGSGAQAEG